MKTANKVIDDRIVILDNFLEKTKDSTEPGVQMNRGNANLAKGLFNQLKLAIEEHTNLLNAGVNNEDLVDKIKELVGQTMSPLVERNKQVIDSYKQKMFSLHQRSEEIKAVPGFEANASLKTELNDIQGNLFEYNKAKVDTVDYLEEYQTALEEIKQLIEREPDAISEQTDQTEQTEKKDENGEFPI